MTSTIKPPSPMNLTSTSSPMTITNSPPSPMTTTSPASPMTTASPIMTTTSPPSPMTPTSPTSPLSPLLAGCLSAALSTLLLQPLDLVKTRLQQHRDTRMWTEVRSIVSTGGMRSLWVGVTPSLWRTVPGVGLYFTVFHGLAGDRQLAGGEALAVGGVTRVVAGTLLIPVTVVKTRWEARDSRYRGVLRALVTIQQGEGVRGLASGLLPTLLRDVPYSALYLGAYSQLKELLAPRSSALQWDYVLAAVTAGVLATAAVNPADVIKTRMQLPPSPPSSCPPGLMATAGAVFREAGLRGFMVGLAPRVLRKSLMSGLSWTVYEAAMFRGQNNS